MAGKMTAFERENREQHDGDTSMRVCVDATKEQIQGLPQYAAMHRDHSGGARGQSRQRASRT